MNALRTALAAALLASPASAQFGNAWVEFQANPSMLSAPPISDAANEVDFAVGDLDQDGALDVVAVRCPPFTSVGKRTNLLLMNVGGVLTDRTATHSAASDVAGGHALSNALRVDLEP